MRYLRFLLFLAFVASSAAALTSGAVSAQNTTDPLLATCEEGTEPYWNGVCRPVALTDIAIDHPLLENEQFERLQPYGVKFLRDTNSEVASATRRIPYTEYMIVIVKYGCFALDVMEPDSVLVSTPNTKLRVLDKEEDTANDDTIFTGPDHSPPPECTATPEGADTVDCVFTCAIDPMKPVLLQEGDVAFAKKGAVCLWCLMHASSGDVPGGLEVLALIDTDNPDSFSWIHSWDNPDEEFEGSPTPTMHGASAIRAFAFNPGGSRCHGS